MEKYIYILSIYSHVFDIDDVKEIINSNCLNYLLKVILSTDQETSINLILKLFGNCIVANNQISYYLLRSGILEAIDKCLESSNHFIKLNTVWLTSNLVADYKEVVLEVLESSILEKIYLFAKGHYIDLIREACFVVSGIVQMSDDEMIKKVLELNTLDMLNYVINHINNDEVLLIALRSIELMFLLGDNMDPVKNINPIVIKFINIGGKDRVDSLIENKNTEIFEICDKLQSIFKKNQIY